jgi:hypothetical protein
VLDKYGPMSIPEVGFSVREIHTFLDKSEVISGTWRNSIKCVGYDISKHLKKKHT